MPLLPQFRCQRIIHLDDTMEFGDPNSVEPFSKSEDKTQNPHHKNSDFYSPLI